MIYYIIELGDDSAVKIGVANDPDKRLRTLQIGNRRKLRIILLHEGDIALEQKIHKAFAAYRIQGEWFSIEGKLKTILEPYLLAIVAPQFDKNGKCVYEGVIAKTPPLIEELCKKVPIAINDIQIMDILKEQGLSKSATHTKGSEIVVIDNRKIPLPVLANQIRKTYNADFSDRMLSHALYYFTWERENPNILNTVIQGNPD